MSEVFEHKIDAKAYCDARVKRHIKSLLARDEARAMFTLGVTKDRARAKKNAQKAAFENHPF